MKARTCPGYECAAGAHSQVRHILIILQISLRLSASAVRGIQNGHTEPFQMPTGDTLRFDFRVLFTGVGPLARFTALRHDFRAGLADVRLSAGKKTSPELCFVECEPRTCELCVMHREQIAKSLRHNFGLLHRAGKAKCDFSHH